MAPRTLCWLVLFVLTASLSLRLQGLLNRTEGDTLYREQALYSQLRGIIKERYVDEIDTDKQKKMFFAAMDGMVSALDKHTQFLPPARSEELDEYISGQLPGGVGIELDDSNGLRVSTPISNSPAFLAGILPGDRIVKIDGKPSDKMKGEEAKQLIRGAPGTFVTLSVLHLNQTEPVDINIKRAIIEMPSISISEFLPSIYTDDDTKIGCIKVDGFKVKTSSELETELNRMEGQGMRALILDFRGNRGGVLSEAINICDFFLKDGPMVSVINKDRENAKDNNHDTTASTRVYIAKAEGTHPDYPLAILVDSDSASASEVVSGSLQDRRRAVLVGERTFGKFSVQEPMHVPLGGDWGTATLKLTVARYKTPAGECKDGQGIVPDHVVPITPEQQKAVLLANRQRHLRENDPRGNTGSDKAAETALDPQLKKAAEVLKQMLPPSRAAGNTNTGGAHANGGGR
jgi:carboxyl-terminal processing protease